jgi:beta-barrel assembly-enhancing protease
MTIRARLAAVVLILGLAACGHPAPSAGLAQDGPQTRLDNLTRQDVRVAAVAWRLALTNADLCPVNRLRAGWTLQSASQYGGELRPLAERRYGLDGDLPGILAVPTGSPGAEAGLQPGDLILSVNGEALLRGGGATESYDGLQANIAVLDQALSRGPVQLRIRRDGLERTIALRPVLACAYPTQVEVTGTLRGRADGRHIFISDGMANLAETDDQLAFVLAHELAHAVLEHRTQPDVIGVRGASNWAISMRRGLSLSAEADADRMGLFLTARSGFDPHAAMAFLDLYEAADSGSRYTQVNMGGVYEPVSIRRRALEPVLADIAERRTTGRALIP